MLIVIKGLTTPPVDVNNLSIVTLNGTALLTWDLAPDSNFVLFRYSGSISGATWENAIKLTSTSSQNNSVSLPLLIGTYLAKFVDIAGNQSVNATSVVVANIANIAKMNTAYHFYQNPSFIGVKTNMVVVANNLQFAVNGGDLHQTGSYEFDYDIDISSVQTARVTVNITSNATNEADDIDDRTDLIDAWDSIDNPPANVAIETFISTTDDDPLGSPTWTPWVSFTIADYTARAFKFKLEASASNLNHQIKISELSASVELPDRTETGRDITSGTATKNIMYTTPFAGGLIDIPVVSITPIDMTTGDYFVISNESFLGFYINFYNSSDVAISRIFNYSATGY